MHLNVINDFEPNFLALKNRKNKKNSFHNNI